MATLKKPDAEMTKHYEELALRWLNFMKFRLAQDGATFRDQIVEWFGRWIVCKPSRITRYENADFKMLDQFLDFAWPSIMDPSVPLPPEPEEAKKVVARAGNWWGDDIGRGIMQDAQRIDWHAVAQRARQQAPEQQFVINAAAQQGQQWVVMDENGNWRPNR